MSADNGIYILETESPNGPEYRVRELQAVENLNWDESTHTETSDPYVIIQNARRMWNGCEVFTVRTDALEEAFKQLKKTYICEYGINHIKVNRRF